jgi:hypothetical protein
MTNANVVCWSLGFSRGASSFWNAGGGSSLDIALDGVICTDTERFIGDCHHLAWWSHNCNHNEDIGVSCVLNADPASAFAGKSALGTESVMIAVVGGSCFVVAALVMVIVKRRRGQPSFVTLQETPAVQQSPAPV